MEATQARLAATRRTPEYVAWSNMRQRVKRSPYIEQGITICERWSEFENFLADMGEKPERLVLARLDSKGDFEPGNCHWATSRMGDAARTHGHNRDNGKSPTYRTWDNMIQRCTNPRTPGYRYYAERGITICQRWRTFANFLDDMGERPEGMTLDRRDNDLGYWCGHCDECLLLDRSANCRWADWSTQMKNRRPSAASLANLRHGPGGEAAVATALARAGLEVPQ